MINSSILNKNREVGFVVKIGKRVKKLIRLTTRIFRFGIKPYAKEISLPKAQFKILINPTANGCVDQTIALDGYWEKGLTDALSSVIQPNSIFLDIGANIGYHSLFVASLLSNKGAVHAFEPISHLSKQIEDSANLNDFQNLKVYNFGLGDENTKKRLYIRDENMGGSSLQEYENLNLVKVSSTREIQIKRLDSVLPPETHIDVIKIDVEGYEFEALKGAEHTLSKNRPIIFMEFSPLMYEEDYTGKTIEFVTYLKGLNYQFYTLNDNEINLSAWVESKKRTQVDIKCVSVRSLK